MEAAYRVSCHSIDEVSLLASLSHHRRCLTFLGACFDPFPYGLRGPLGTHSHIHMHIISEDLCSKNLKTKKHYNSFHPSLGFFLLLDDVLSWFDDDAPESDLRAVSFFFA